MNQLVISVLIFVLSITVIELGCYAFKNMTSRKRAILRKKLKRYAYVENPTRESDILKKRVLSDIPILDRFLSKIPGILKLDSLLIQANSNYPLSVYMILMVVLGFLTGWVSQLLIRAPIVSVTIGFLFASLPVFFLRSMRQKRIKKFQYQFPEGLDLIARALKAGNAFIGGLQVAAEQFDDPLGPEFSEMVDEINFGVSVSDALKNLTKRIGCEEIKYFAIAVILQRETGGNLADLLDGLSRLIREKFKLQGKVRILSAESKLSAVILSLLPFFIVAYVQIANPAYLKPLYTEQIGKIMIGIGVVLMVLGIISMKKMSNIKI
jgi:tight adherence protein B